jgi:hypothetical protein
VIGSRIDDKLRVDPGENFLCLFGLGDVKLRIIKRENLMSPEDFNQVRPELAVSSDDSDSHFKKSLCFERTKTIFLISTA